MRNQVFIVEREFSGSSREIVGVTFDKEIITPLIEQDLTRWTFPVSYHISLHFPSYLAESKNA